MLAAIVARSCQQAQIRVSQAEAIAIAKRQIDFKPKSTQIRLLRQGLNRKPFWFVSLSDPIGSAIHPQGYTRIVVVEIDANTGKVEDVNNESVSPPSPPKGKKSREAAARPKRADRLSSCGYSSSSTSPASLRASSRR